MPEINGKAMPQINFSMLHRWKDLQQIRVELKTSDVYHTVFIVKKKPQKGWYVEKRTSHVRYCMSEYGTGCYRDHKHEIIAGAEHFDRLDQAKRWIKQNLDLLM